MVQPAAEGLFHSFFQSPSALFLSERYINWLPQDAEQHHLLQLFFNALFDDIKHQPWCLKTGGTKSWS